MTHSVIARMSDARRLSRVILALIAAILSVAPAARAQDEFGEEDGDVPPDVIADPPPPMPRINLDARDVLLIVNSSSPVSVSIGNLYRQFHPQITDEQVVYVSGLPDAASTSGGPAQEILFRSDYNTRIAQPVRDHLIAHDMVNSVYVIITTAGVPYRIEDTNESASAAGVVCPAGTSGCTQGTNPGQAGNVSNLNAASVESELSCLFVAEGGATANLPGCLTAVFPLFNRMANPYQGYESPIRMWGSTRDMLTRRGTFKYTYLQSTTGGPKIEGDCQNIADPTQYAMVYNRRFSPADMYLVARLDGPRDAGQTPLAAVQAMLGRAAAVSDPSYPGFVGYNPATSAVVVDSTPSPPALGNLGFTRTINIPPFLDFLSVDEFPAPPSAAEFGTTRNEKDHFKRTVELMTRDGLTDTAIHTYSMVSGLGGTLVWDGTTTIANSSLLSPGVGLIALMTFGRNGNDGRNANNYLLVNGPGGGPLFTCVPGAIFISIESFNAVTMFTSVTTTNQGKIAQFFSIGGSGAIGHAFEPQWSASVQGEFLVANYLRDDDGDGVGDMTFVEAAYTALPFLSWSEVVVGDPLMRLHLGAGGATNASEGGPIATAGESAEADEDLP